MSRSPHRCNHGAEHRLRDSCDPPEKRLMLEQQALVERLIALVGTLYAETVGFLDLPGEQQLWYNRGYANGMVKALRALGFGAEVERAIAPDREDVAAGQDLLPWGQAFSHGLEMGDRETHQILGGDKRSLTNRSGFQSEGDE